MPAIDFMSPWALGLLPLALLPLLPLLHRTADDSLPIGSTEWLPRDRLGMIAEGVWRSLAVGSIGLIVVALAGPGRAESGIERMTRGAELSILLDRSASMDAGIRYGLPQPGDAPRVSTTKNRIVREALATLVATRPDNRYALTLFNAAPIRVSPFGDDSAIVQAALAGSAIGRGPSETNMGRALLAAIDSFEGRAYTGSRAILLVSDGGARLDEVTRRRISQGLARERVALYFIYVRSSPNSPELEHMGPNAQVDVEEVALHVFFEGLDTDYEVFDAEDPASMAAAVERIDERQNLPLTWIEKRPRVDHRKGVLGAALVAGLGLLALSGLRIGGNA